MRPKCPRTGKVCYTKNQAKAAARREGRWTIGHLSTYKCPHHASHPDGAGLFHIGHTPGQTKRRQRRRR